ncbi:4Fe-4S dicluster domain-containing protein [Yeosuana marina]|uniref:4Fe-4S dicluster domain-containing protein n=1 Tax=Yeosuana marina TaxID=1565536 RepID=UPI001421D59F|nr:4Fe-4S dicluster domain-containing protein [Yeosuana marina]|tara:strand:+ start:1646 stop:1876 length:231 start_codon:yes stop_codon:yes gene_type:complete
MAKVKGAIVVNTETCKGCEVCMPVCPEKVIGMSSEVNRKGFHFAYMEHPEDCTGCTNCGLVCPDRAITVYRVKTSD